MYWTCTTNYMSLECGVARAATVQDQATVISSYHTFIGRLSQSVSAFATFYVTFIKIINVDRITHSFVKKFW